MQPNFLHIGASKAASSWLWRVCQQHPRVFVPPVIDNVNFFTVHYHRGLEWYEETYFSGVADEAAVGEFSNSYIVYAPAIERIAQHLPEAKLTVTLRKPAQALFLAWAHSHLKKKAYGFDGRQGTGVRLDRILHHHGHSWFRMYAEPRFYARHLQRIFTIIPRERVLVMLYDDLCAEPEAFLQRFFSFLGVDPEFQSDLVGVDINPDAPDAEMANFMSPELIAELHEVFRPDVEQLEEMIGRDLGHWLR